jgi:integrase
VDDEILPRNPVLRFCKVHVPRKRKIVLDHGQPFGPEWISFYRNIPEKWRLFFLICYETGMRPGEVSKMETTWLKETPYGFIIEIPQDSEKTAFHDRRIPVSPILKKRLLPYIENCNNKLFCSSRYEKAVKKTIKAAGLRDEITAYALRRTRATIWDAIDSSAARVALGHSPLDPHEESYVEITTARLFRLVGIQKPILQIYKKTG